MQAKIDIGIIIDGYPGTNGYIVSATDRTLSAIHAIKNSALHSEHHFLLPGTLVLLLIPSEPLDGAEALILGAIDYEPERVNFSFMDDDLAKFVEFTGNPSAPNMPEDYVIATPGLARIWSQFPAEYTCYEVSGAYIYVTPQGTFASSSVLEEVRSNGFERFSDEGYVSAYYAGDDTKEGLLIVGSPHIPLYAVAAFNEDHMTLSLIANELGMVCSPNIEASVNGIQLQVNDNTVRYGDLIIDGNKTYVGGDSYLFEEFVSEQRDSVDRQVWAYDEIRGTYINLVAGQPGWEPDLLM